MKNKKKKVIVRIGAILACVLLVGSLAIPAFAATPYDNIETNFYNYLDTVGVTNTVRTGFIDGNYNPFIWDAITAGSVQFINDIDAGFYTTTNLPDFKSSMDCTYVYRVNNEEISIPHEGTLSIQLVGSRCLVTFSDDGNKIIEVTYNVSYVYDQTINARKAYFSYVGVYVFYDADTVNSLDIGILINNTEVAYFNNLLRLMFGHSSVGYPKTFQTSLDVYWHDGYNAGVQDGNTDGYNLGYENGYDVGASAGYESGYQAGLESGLDSDAYQAGYNDATKDIDSGEFGKNLIGSVLSAPFDALRSFTLVEWTMAGGTKVTINLAVVLSAAIGIAIFVWFLKTFAGG